MTLLLTLACGPRPQLLPSQEDQGLGALPADATLLVGMDLEQLADSRVVERWRHERADALADLDARFFDRFGFRPTEMDRALLACNADGCAWLVDGALDSLDIAALGSEAAYEAYPVQEVRLLPAQEALMFRTPRGQKLRLQRLDEHRAAIGHGSAVRSLVATQEDGAPGGPSLGEAVPAGQVWALARQPQLMRTQVVDFLESQGELELSARVDELWGLRPELLDGIESVGLSVSLDSPERLAVRATCTDEDSARAVLGVAAPLLEARRVEAGLDPRLGQALSQLELVRVGRQVELRGADTLGLVDQLIDVVERAP